MYIHSQKKTFGLKVILPKYKSYKTKLKNQFPFGTSRVTLDTLALVQRFHYRFLSFYLFSKGSQYLEYLITAHAFLLIKVSHSIYMFSNQIDTKSFETSWTTSNCPSLQAIWNGVFLYVGLFGTLE